MGEQTFDTGVGSGWVMDEVVEFDEPISGCRLMRLATVARLDEGRGFEYVGYTSTSAFLTHRCGMSSGEASREVFVARSLDHWGTR